jgi:gamma-glutamyltranspeptidase/glutathione hydrolase
MKHPLHIFILLLVLVWSCKPVQHHTYKLYKGEEPYPIQKVYTSTTGGLVVSAHPLASEVGAEILRQGGNAVDAAIAVQFALAVVYPGAGNIGGGGFMVYRSLRGEVACLDFREKAPAAATRDMYLDAAGQVIPNLSTHGHKAAGVPGTVAGMAEAHRKFGKMPWRQLVTPALQLAARGFPITSSEAARLNESAPDFKKYNTSACAFLKPTPWQKGEVLKQPNLARTLRRIRAQNTNGFYHGQTAKLIVAEMERGGGIITADDLKNYRAIWRTPLTFQYKDYLLHSMPPPSSGGICLAQLLQMVAPYPIAEWGYHDPRTVHLMAEAERRVYADRAKHLGDPDFLEVPLSDKLRSSTYAKRRMADFNASKATPSTSIQAGDPLASGSEETTHFNVIDAEGNAVAITTTLNGSYGAYTVVGGAGFLLNNEMDDFSVKPGTPNLYGLIGSEANAIAPGKRMLSSMTPTIVEKHGSLYAVLGTPGGSTIITSVFQTFLNLTEFKKSPQDAVWLPRFHHQWLPDQIYYEENAFTAEQLRVLEVTGHKMQQRTPIGRMELVLRNADGTLTGVADNRGDDAVAAQR